LCIARPIYFKLLVHWIRRAASRADCTAGSKSAIKTALIAITTKSSIRVNPVVLVVLDLVPIVPTRPPPLRNS